jgi:hypothetical protein
MNIHAEILNRISPGMRQILDKTKAAKLIIADQSKPLELINLILSTDFSLAAQMMRGDKEKYLDARIQFDSTVLSQRGNESANDFSKRFRAEYAKIEQLAAAAGIKAELPSSEIQAYTFFSKLHARYQPLREDYAKKIKVKPTDIDAMLEDIACYETVVDTKKHHVPEKMVLVASAQAPTKRPETKRINKRTPDGSTTAEKRFRCEKHSTNDHARGDSGCAQQDRIEQAAVAKYQASQAAKSKSKPV